jgi:hypothetical protein
MAKKRLIVYLVVGILGGLFVSACAGVAAGTVDLPAAGEVPLVGGPAVDFDGLTSFEITRPGNSATFEFQKAVVEGQAPETDPALVGLQSVGVQSSLQDLYQGATQVQAQGHFCSRP